MVTERACELPGRTLLVLVGLMGLALIGLMGCAPARYPSSYDDQAEIDDVQYLSSYGVWVYVPSYGTVWRPDVVPGWQPFYYGHWIWTDDDWVWASYEPYGWLVYHYGFWGYDPGIGWFWVPGDAWYPARVQWYIFDDYIGWAPIPPPGIVWLDPWDPYDIDVWIVVEIDDFSNEDVGRYVVERPVYREISAPRTIIKRAPDVREIESATMRKVPVVEIREQPARVRHRAVQERPEPGERTEQAQPAAKERSDVELKRMVLPAVEKRKVEKQAERVEKEVLTRRKADEAPPERSSEDKRDTSKNKRK
jgi:hypothetical protein